MEKSDGVFNTVNLKISNGSVRPFVLQSTDFTCGSAALMTAFAVLDENYKPSLKHEIDIWRNANTIFMGSGQAGSCAVGLAIEAVRYGYLSRVYLSDKAVPFIHTVRNSLKKKVIEHEFGRFCRSAESLGIAISQDNTDFEFVRSKISARSVCIFLITYVEGSILIPHWVLGYRVSGEEIVVWDPASERHTWDSEQTISEKDYIEFGGHGRKNYRMAIEIYKE